MRLSIIIVKLFQSHNTRKWAYDAVLLKFDLHFNVYGNKSEMNIFTEYSSKWKSQRISYLFSSWANIFGHSTQTEVPAGLQSTNAETVIPFPVACPNWDTAVRMGYEKVSEYLGQNYVVWLHSRSGNKVEMDFDYKHGGVSKRYNFIFDGAQLTSLFDGTSIDCTALF